MNLALCPNEDRLCAVTSNNQLLGVKIASHNTKENNMEPVISLFHGRGVDGCGGGITGMDTCVRKPLVATCGVDRTVRVWNIVEQRLDTWKMFQEEPCSLAMHPSGLHIVVGFVDKLRVMNLSMDDMRTCRDIPIKQCREVKFSNGGSMIAAANGNVVTVFDFITFNKLVDLRGHNSKVISDNSLESPLNTGGSHIGCYRVSSRLGPDSHCFTNDSNGARFVISFGGPMTKP